MSQLQLVFIVFLSIFVFLSYLSLLRNTVFGINITTGHYPGFFIFFSLVTSILPSSILLNSFPIEDFWVAFQVKQESVFFTSVLVLYTSFIFIVTLYLISRIFPKKFSCLYYEFGDDKKNYLTFIRLSLIFCLIIILLAWLILGVGHSFTISLIDDVSVSGLRSGLNDSTLAKFIKHMFTIICPLLSVLVASGVYKNRKLERYVSFVIIIFIAAWGGNKAPILLVMLIYLVTYASVNNYKLSLKLLTLSIVALFVILFATYRIVLFQYSDMTDISSFIDYFFQRVFVAGLIGVYEQMNLFLNDLNYIYHAVPFASFFVDYPNFHKDLMMVSEHRVDESSIGIKNTLFIAEAYAMAGWGGVILSPVIVAVNYAISFRVITIVFSMFFPGHNQRNNMFIAIFFFSYLKITGGFSDFLFFKTLIMMVILMLPFFFIAWVSKFRFVFNS
ncbi:TPA: hypothetical protein I7147_07895 [Vibrio vulnificus]|nr:hypothetical protein [Vibrio vulnificus]HAS6223897.1 hypothetical protein [Vibrio vulnificus]HAS6271532.1 hypothetical protein [Vibrio vulnificus]